MNKKQYNLPLVIENAMYGFMLSQILFTGDELGIFNVFSDGKNHSAEEVAKITETDSYAVECLLIAAVANKLLNKNGNQFTMPEDLIPFLAYDSALYCGTRFPHYRDSTTKTFNYLKQAMQDGKPQISRLLNENSENLQNIFKNIYANPISAQAFLNSMWGLGIEPAKDLLNQYSLHKYQHLIDLGGATGSFSIPALLTNQNLSATIFDLPEVEVYFNEKCQQYSLSDRLKFKSGNFFTDDIPAGDIYVLGYILSDWSTETGTELLTKIFHKLPSGGIVIILEKLFNDEKTGPMQTAMMNLAMFMETEGKHRSRLEYIGWLTEIGFHNIECIYSSADKHMIIGHKK